MKPKKGEWWHVLTFHGEKPCIYCDKGYWSMSASKYRAPSDVPVNKPRYKVTLDYNSAKNASPSTGEWWLIEKIFPHGAKVDEAMIYDGRFWYSFLDDKKPQQRCYQHQSDGDLIILAKIVRDESVISFF